MCRGLVGPFTVQAGGYGAPGPGKQPGKTGGHVLLDPVELHPLLCQFQLLLSQTQREA